MIFYTCNRGVATGRARGTMLLPRFNFQTKQGPPVSVSNNRDISFYGCSEIIRIRNFTIFTVNATVFGQFTAAFYNYIGEIDHFTLDFLKKSDTKPCTFWKVSYCGPSERRPQWTKVRTFDYRRNPGSTEKVLYNKAYIHVSDPQLNIIASIMERLKIFSKVIVAFNCILLAKFEKQVMS